MTGEFRKILAEKKKGFTTHKLVEQNYFRIQMLAQKSASFMNNILL